MPHAVFDYYEIKSSGKWVEHAACMWTMNHVYKFLFRKPGVGPKSIWEDNIVLDNPGAEM